MWVVQVSPDGSSALAPAIGDTARAASAATATAQTRTFPRLIAARAAVPLDCALGAAAHAERPNL
jgi:hypothetical protein